MSARRLGAVIAVAVLAACSTAVPTDTPGVTQRSRYVLNYDGPELRAELAYRWASTHLGEQWLAVKLSLSAAAGAAPVVEHGAISVRAPDGRDVVLVDKAGFWEANAALRIALDVMDAWGPPISRIEGQGRACSEWFLVPPGNLNDRTYLRLEAGSWCSGPLVFAVPGGVQPGRWTLRIELEESDVRIPFELGG